MNADTKQFFLTGEAGNLECALDLPGTEPAGIALLAHPHPLYGGTMNNKVVQMMARSFVGLGYAAARMNFRGVGRSGGMHDYGNGEYGSASGSYEETVSRPAVRFGRVFVRNLCPVQAAATPCLKRASAGKNGIRQRDCRKMGSRKSTGEYGADSWRTG